MNDWIHFDMRLPEDHILFKKTEFFKGYCIMNTKQDNACKESAPGYQMVE